MKGKMRLYVINYLFEKAGGNYMKAMVILQFGDVQPPLLVSLKANPCFGVRQR
jgi:hypothetical protein